MKHASTQYAGIWLDGHHATIISSGQNPEFEISSQITGSESQSGGSEHSMNNGKKTEHEKFFKEIASKLTGFDEILIFGPGQTQEQLKNHLKDNVHFNMKHISVDSADKLTDPQKMAKVRDFFKGRMS